MINQWEDVDKPDGQRLVTVVSPVPIEDGGSLFQLKHTISDLSVLKRRPNLRYSCSNVTKTLFNLWKIRLRFKTSSHNKLEPVSMNIKLGIWDGLEQPTCNYFKKLGKTTI